MNETASVLRGYRPRYRHHFARVGWRVVCGERDDVLSQTHLRADPAVRIDFVRSHLGSRPFRLSPEHLLVLERVRSFPWSVHPHLGHGFHYY